MIASNLSRFRAFWIRWLDSNSTDRVSIEVYETQIFESVFHQIRDYMFELFFLTTLDIYKDYFKGRQRWHKLHKCWAKFCSSKLWSETKFTLIHLSCEEAAMFVHRKVLWTSNFIIFIVWWTEELYSQQPSLVGDRSRVLGSAQLVSHILGAVHWKREIVTTKQVQLGIGVRVQL